jgi:hypothetical protein
MTVSPSTGGSLVPEASSSPAVQKGKLGVRSAVQKPVNIPLSLRISNLFLRTINSLLLDVKELYGAVSSAKSIEEAYAGISGYHATAIERHFFPANQQALKFTELEVQAFENFSKNGRLDDTSFKSLCTFFKKAGFNTSNLNNLTSIPSNQKIREVLLNDQKDIKIVQTLQRRLNDVCHTDANYQVRDSLKEFASKIMEEAKIGSKGNVIDDGEL